ncbi:MAG: ornithine carbamoyltransferase, partial [Chloroflexota bacterium]
LEGLTIAYVGDGNNVANSLMIGAALVGMDFRIAAPEGYWPRDNVLRLAQRLAAKSGAHILCTEDPAFAVRGADVVYTDVWTSMGQEEEREQRLAAFAGFQVDGRLFSVAKGDAIFMHPLPAHRGEEVASEVIDSPQSAVFLQAENRMHVQKAILVRLLKKDQQAES